MGLDDANVGAEPGECPAHIWEIKELRLKLTGAEVWQECISCGTLKFKPGNEPIDFEPLDAEYG